MNFTSYLQANKGGFRPSRNLYVRTGVNVKGERVSTLKFLCFCSGTLGYFANILFHQRALDSNTRTTTSKRFSPAILSIARACTGILAGKRDSRRHSATDFSVNVVVVETSYLMLEVLSICDRERA